jgi:Ca-activated chloride channel family protein
MIQFAWPFISIVFLLPFLIRWLLPPAPHHANVALKVPFFYRIKELNNKKFVSTTYFKIKSLMWLIWFLLVFASTRPQLPDTPVEQTIGHDLLIAVDISKSMANTDLGSQGTQDDHLSVVKQVVSKFIEKHSEDRVGLILFGERAYLQTPLTFDLITTKNMLQEAFIGLVPSKDTNISEAIGLAIKRLKNKNQENKALILITDGNNTAAGEIQPLQAAEWANNEGINIYVIGLVSDKIRTDTPTGSKATPFDLDEKTLKEIVTKTKGEYFKAGSSAELEEIFHKKLNKLQPVKTMLSHNKELYPWPLGIALFLSFLLIPLKISRI